MNKVLTWLAKNGGLTRQTLLWSLAGQGVSSLLFDFQAPVAYFVGVAAIAIICTTASAVVAIMRKRGER